MSDERLTFLLEKFRLEPTPENAYFFTTEFLRIQDQDFNLDEVSLTSKITASVEEPIPPGANPFRHDFFHMGTGIGNNIIIMHRGHPSDKIEYFIVINTNTGERILLTFKD